MEENKFAILGETQSILIFKSQNVDCYIVDKHTIEEIFNEIYNKNYKIIFITETLYKSCEKYIEKEKIYPAVTILPDLLSKKNLGKINIAKLARTATGIEIITV